MDTTALFEGLPQNASQLATACVSLALTVLFLYLRDRIRLRGRRP